MKKGFAVILAGLFLLTCVVAVGHAAAVDWDKIRTPGGVAGNPPSALSPTAVEEGGTHWYRPNAPGGNWPPNPPPSLITSGANGDYGDIVQDQLNISHFDSILQKNINWTYDAYSATADLPDGLTHNAAARYTVNDPLAGVQGGFITANSSTSRTFLPIGRGTITVDAELTNLPTWENSNYDFSIPGPANPVDPYYHAWRVVGGVQVHEITLDDQGVASNDIVANILLDSLVLQGTIQTILIGNESFTPKVSDKIYYEIRAQLAARIEVNTITFPTGITGPDATPLEIGSWTNPLDAPVVLDALVDQQAVPIPGSLFLLLSGIGGLTVIRRRMLSKS